jgi:DNA-binding HxlR family transcriptional regulator
VDSREPGASVAAAGARVLLEILASRWAAGILAALEGGPRRLTEIRARVGRVSSEALVATLRRLERQGLVASRVVSTSPPRVDYRLTAAGTALVPSLKGFREWSARYADVLAESRARSGRAAMTVPITRPRPTGR